ncbi:MAG: dihydroorotate dehydrogenase [Candidatus Gastranaerophilales bacterium]|nr:dihydroorotate dehydrogenase [Candidatus Gastranaerophilales bacterium]
MGLTDEIFPKKNMEVNLNGFKLKSPILAASGTFGYADEYENYVNVSNIGAIVTKAISLKPRFGNEGCRLFETTGGLINRIGLENIGIDEFIEKKLPVLKEKNIAFIMNTAGSTFEEYTETARIAQNAGIKAIELNVSCPNVKEGCLEFGTNPDTLSYLTEAVRKVYKGFLIVKLTPNTNDIKALALAAEKSGADCISAINTLRGLGIKLEYLNNEFKKTMVQGGLSGKCIKPAALFMVKSITEAVKIPVIGIGGISTFEDVLEFFAAGAQAVQIGTENFTNPDITEKITLDLQNFLKKTGIETMDELKRKLK